MPTYRVRLLEQLGWVVHVSHTHDAHRLARDWRYAGFIEAVVTYKARAPHHTEEEKRIVPWHMVAFIEPDPLPIVTPDVTLQGDLLYGQDGHPEGS